MSVQRRTKNKNIRVLTRPGGGKSYGITLPIELVRELAWRERQKLIVTKRGDKLIIEDWKE